MRTWYHASLNQGELNEEGTITSANMPPKPAEVDAVSVILNKGDVVIAHQLLPHRIGLNYSPNIRYQVYYRVWHKDH